jgi:phosphoglycerate dehydrogenase-like enzyme
MRVHIQTEPGDAARLTAADFHAAVAAAGMDAAAFALTAAEDAAGFVAGMADAEILLTTNAALRPLLPLTAPNLQLIFVNSAGVDGSAPFDWLPPGVTLLNNRGVHGPKAQGYVTMALSMLGHRLPEMLDNQRAGRWRQIFTPVLAGRRAVIVGTGYLGGAAARAAGGLGMDVTGVSRSGAAHPACRRVAPFTDIDAVLPQAAFLVLACPLTPETSNLLDRRRLALLPDAAGVVNIGRGPLLDQDALCDELDAGRLGGAVLDVAVPEPLPPGHRLWRTPRAVVTPHVSCDQPNHYNAASLAVFFVNFKAWQAGEVLPNRVDVTRGY